MKMKYFALIVLLFSFGAFAGTRDSGGGDAIALDFLSTAEKIAAWLDSQSPDVIAIPGFSGASFKNKLANLKLRTTNQVLYVNGVAKDAVNYPAKERIVVNRSRWSEISNQYQKISLVVHEFLGLLGIEDTLYSQSAKVGAKIIANKKSPTQYFLCVSTMTVFGPQGKLLFSDKQSGVIQFESISGGTSAHFVHSFEGETYKLQGSIPWETSSSDDPGHASIDYMMLDHTWLEANVMIFSPILPASIGVSFGRFANIGLPPGRAANLMMVCTEQ